MQFFQNNQTRNQNINQLVSCQNETNPFQNITSITYYIDEAIQVNSAEIQVRDLFGALKNTVVLIDKSGIGKIDINCAEYTDSYYVYSLIINGTTVDTKLFLKHTD